jgi:hypothetical protein
MHQLVGMGEMRRMGEIGEKLLPYLLRLPHLPYLPHLHSRQKDQLLMTTPLFPHSLLSTPRAYCRCFIPISRRKGL